MGDVSEVLRKHGRYLGENNRQEMPEEAIHLDVEGKVGEGEVQQFKLGFAIYSRRQNGKWHDEEFPFYKRDDFYDWFQGKIESRPKSLIYGESFGMKYDFLSLRMHHFLSQKRGWSVPSPMVFGRPFLYYTRFANGAGVDFMDTINWFSNSQGDGNEEERERGMAAVAAKFGEHKLPKPDFTDVSDEELMRYCRQDVICHKAIFNGVIDWVKLHDLGNFQPTVAGMALGGYTHRFMEPKSIVIPILPKLVEFERESYHGGRTETFRFNDPLGIGTAREVFYSDVNSHYPACMKGHKLPCAPKSYEPEEILSDDLPSVWKHDYAIVRCEVELNRPCLAVKRKWTQFPAKGSRVITVLSQPELDMFNSHPEYGRVNRYLEGCRYAARDDLFDAYVDYFFDLKAKAKAEGDTVTEVMCKLFLNALYGKFGQYYKPKPEECPEFDEKGRYYRDLRAQTMKDDGKTVDYDDDYSYVFLGEDRLMRIPTSRMKGAGMTWHTFVAIASGVTAYGRCRIWEIMDAAGIRNLYSVDTDGFYHNKRAKERLEEAGLFGPELGKLKCTLHSSLRGFGLKDYEVDGKWKCKGIRVNDPETKRVDWESWEQSQFCTGMSHFLKGDPDGVRVGRIVKHLNRQYHKGIVVNGHAKGIVFKEW